MHGAVTETRTIADASPTGGGIRVVVLSCDPALGAEVANGIASLDQVRSVDLLSAPWTRKRLALVPMVRRLHRLEGWRGVLRAIAGRVARMLASLARLGRASAPDDASAASGVALAPSIRRHDVDDFHSPECADLVRRLAPDLGVIAGTYILRESVFAAPRMGSINLHSGKAPQYRGAAPAFWELYNGERSVGITIHRVAAELDAGDILLQEEFPLDPAPPGDPLDYVERYREEVLRPNGVRLLLDAVRGIAAGTTRPRPQGRVATPPYRTPDHSAKQELRRRVRARRLAGSDAA